MNTSAPALMPIFKSDAQAKILAWLLLDPTREQSIASLAPVAGVGQPSVLKEVNRLLEAGLLQVRRAGNTRLVSAAQSSPYYEPLVQILQRTFGPADAAAEELGALPGVEDVVMIGSWAARYAGEPGPSPRDVDIVVVGDPDRRAVRRANAQLEERLGSPVHVTIVSSQDWQDSQDGFVREVRSRPHLSVGAGERA